MNTFSWEGLRSLMNNSVSAALNPTIYMYPCHHNLWPLVIHAPRLPPTARLKPLPCSHPSAQQPWRCSRLHHTFTLRALTSRRLLRPWGMPLSTIWWWWWCKAMPMHGKSLPNQNISLLSNWTSPKGTEDNRETNQQKSRFIGWYLASLLGRSLIVRGQTILPDRTSPKIWVRICLIQISCMPADRPLTSLVVALMTLRSDASPPNPTQVTKY